MAKTNVHNSFRNSKPQQNPPPPYSENEHTSTMSHHSNERAPVNRAYNQESDMEMTPLTGGQEQEVNMTF